ncbi:MAG: hypothetical protein K2R93_02050 [Gemmatimonadaceae bacterium]|nr:hypothetical protein [Gemmatimonadaceae bacterium]
MVALLPIWIALVPRWRVAVRAGLLGLVALAGVAGLLPAQVVRLQPNTPFAFDTSEIKVTRDPARMVGTLLTPRGVSKPPIVLFVGGAGPVDRNGNLAGAPLRTDAFRQLAESLATRGIASLRYDKRGVGANAPATLPEHQTVFDVFSLDVGAWIYELRRRTMAPVVVLGHDEGALVAAVSQRGVPADAYIFIGGPSRQADELLREQLLPGQPADVAARIDTLIRAMRADSIVDAVPFQLAGLFRPTLQPYLISWMRYHPAAEMSRILAPCLLVHGVHDLQQTAAEADTLAKAQPLCLRASVDSMTHTLKRGGSELAQQEAAWRDPNEPLAPGLVRTIADFVTLVTAKPPASCGADSVAEAAKTQLLIERPVTKIAPNTIAILDDVYLGRYESATIPATLSDAIASATLVPPSIARRYGPTAAKCGVLRMNTAEALAADTAEIMGAVLKAETAAHVPRLTTMLTLLDSVTSQLVAAPLHRAMVRRNLPIASSSRMGDDTVTIALQQLTRDLASPGEPALVTTRVRWSTPFTANGNRCRLRYDVMVVTEVRRQNGKWVARRTDPELKSIGGCVPMGPP